MSHGPLVRLFAYGTLGQDDVQMAIYGRTLQGVSDVLSGFRLEPLSIANPEVVRLSGKAVHTIACASGNPLDRVPGLMFELTAAELVATDRYEVDAYARVEVRLESGIRAFVYAGPDLDGRLSA